MKYPAYPRYKPSGVEWLGNVPDHWDVKRLKYLASINDEALPETTDPNLEFDYVDIGNVDAVKGIVGAERTDFESAPSRARRIVRDGDTIVSAVRTYLRAIAPIRAVNGKVIVSTGFAVIRPRRAEPNFLSYALRESHFVESVVARSVGVSYPAVNSSDVSDIRIPLPPEPDQRAIADFLDAQTANLDTLIERKGALIERLEEKRTALISRTVTRGLPPGGARAARLDPKPKMKGSGIGWLGDIPDRWETPPLYARYEVELGKMLDESRITGEHLVPYLRNVDVQWDRISLSDLPEMDIRQSEYSRYILSAGDLVVCEGGEIGRAAIFAGSQSPIGFQKALHRLRPSNAREVARFLYYTLFFASKLGVFIAEGNPNTISHLTGEKLRRYRFPKPPRKEQRAIANFLDRETARIDQMMTNLEAAIERLQEYRSTLITAAVTGKIDVRHVA